MSYAFQNYEWHELPPGEQLSILIMQAQIRDGQLTLEEHHARQAARQECLTRIGHPAYAQPRLEVGESEIMTTADGQRYRVTRTQ